MSREELLLQLRDILPPAEPAWWLIAPGYFIVAAILAGLSVIVWLSLRRQRVDRLANVARAELQAIRADYRQDGNVQRVAIKVSRWLKQVAMLAFPASQLQSVSGEAWLRFLDWSLERGQDQDNNLFSQGCGRVFGAEVYQSRVELDADQVFALCEHWLNAIKPRLQHRSRTQ